MGFAAVRALLGVGESGNFPAAIKTTAEWFPRRERALATGIFNSGANIGAVFAPAIIPAIAVAYGWRAAFVIIGALGLARTSTKWPRKAIPPIPSKRTDRHSAGAR
jgi:ACS family hexuronate transporter-like MFS transporter